MIAGILLAQGASLSRRWADRAGSGPTPSEREVAAWVEGHLPPESVIMAIGNGQRIGYYARRPTLAVPHRFFTGRDWNRAAIAEAVRRYGARIVVLTPDRPAAYGAFADALEAGELPPWLTLAHHAEGIRIYRVHSDALPEGGA